MTIRPIIDKTKPLSDGLYTISIYFYKDGKKRVVKTEHRIRPEFWANGAVHKSYAAHEYLNSHLKKLCLEYESRYLKNPGMSLDELINGKDEVVVIKPNLREFLQMQLQYLDSGRTVSSAGQPYSPHFIKSIKHSIARIQEYITNEDFKDVNEEFYHGFVNYLRNERNYNENSLGRVVKALKRLMRTARRKGLHDNFAYEEFATRSQESYGIALSEQEIEQMFSCVLPRAQEAERDRWYVAYNFLLRFTDSITIDERDLVKEKGKWYLSTIPSKTKDRVIIPLLPRTYDILKKYNFKFPHSSNQDSNYKIKEVGRRAGLTELITLTEQRKGKLEKKQVPKYKLITTHTARRSMATNLWHNGFDIKQIQLMGGWRSLTSLQKYLKVDKMDNARKAAEHPFFSR